MRECSEPAVRERFSGAEAFFDVAQGIDKPNREDETHFTGMTSNVYFK